jgi:hypothetical protein
MLKYISKSLLPFTKTYRVTCHALEAAKSQKSASNKRQIRDEVLTENIVLICKRSKALLVDGYGQRSLYIIFLVTNKISLIILYLSVSYFF